MVSYKIQSDTESNEEGINLLGHEEYYRRLEVAEDKAKDVEDKNGYELATYWRTQFKEVVKHLKPEIFAQWENKDGCWWAARIAKVMGL